MAGKTAVQPRSLPPTYDAAGQHFLRACHQVQTWLGHKKGPKDWGWKEVDGKFEPVKITNQPGQENLYVVNVKKMDMLVIQIAHAKKLVFSVACHVRNHHHHHSFNVSVPLKVGRTAPMFVPSFFLHSILFAGSVP